MAVAFDTAQSVVSTNITSGTSASTPALTISASATLAVAFVEMSLAAGFSDVNITGTGTFTLGGQPFTHLASVQKHSGSDSDVAGWVDIYYLVNPPTGSQTATWAPTISPSGTNNGCYTLTVATFTGSSGAPTALTPQNGELVSSLTLTATLAAGDMMAGICCNGSANPGVTTGTSIAAPTGTTDSGSHNTRTARNTGTGSTTIVFSTNSGDWSAATGVKILVSTAAPDAPTVAPTHGYNNATEVVITPGASDGGSAVTGYTVDYALASAPTSWLGPASPSLALTQYITGLTVGTAYVFRAKATNANGDSAWSSTSASLAAVDAIGSVLLENATGVYLENANVTAAEA